MMKGIRAICEKIASSGSMKRDILFLASEKVISLVIGFIVSILIARHLGPQQFGVFSYATAWIAVIAPLATLGLAGPVVKSFVQDPSNAGRIITTTMTLRLVAAIFSGMIAVALINSGLLIESGSQSADSIMVVIMVLSLQYLVQTLDVFESYNQANEKISQTARARFVAFILVSALRVAVIFLGADIVTFAWLTVLQPLLGFGLIYVGARQMMPHLPWIFDLALAKKKLGMGSFIVLAGLLNMAQARFEMIVLEHFVDMEAVGIYAAALRFIELFDTVGVIAVTIYLPRLLVSTKNDCLEDDKLVRIYRIVFWLYIVCIPLIVVMAGFAWWALGNKYSEIHWLILAMGIRPLLAFLGLTRSMAMLAEGQLRYSALCATAGLVTAVISAFFLIPVWGIYGAVASGLLSYSVSNIIIDAVLNKRYFNAFIAAATFK